MFFLSKKIDTKQYTLIHNTFFENILPYLDDKHIRIYMYAYYLANNIEKLGAKSLKDIASILGVDYFDILSTFDYLEKCNLIRKHYVENSMSDNYSVEFLTIEHFNSKKYDSYEEEYITEKNQNLRDMYDKIEQITKIHLNLYDIKKIDTIIKNNDLSYEVVIEAFKFAYYNKNSSNVNDSINILKQWINDGIYTSNDLDENLFNINERYAIYRKILKYFGEYRLPTKPEIKKMDSWIDEYNFSVDIIEKAIDETLKIKSPNFKYLDGILKKWNYIYVAMMSKKIKANSEDYYEFKKDILINLNIDVIDKNQEKLIRFLYQNYPKETIVSAIKYMISNKMFKQGYKKTEELFEFVTSNKSEQELKNTVYFGVISLQELSYVLQKYKEKNNNVKNNKKQSSDKMPDIVDEDLEELILSKNDLNNF